MKTLAIGLTLRLLVSTSFACSYTNHMDIEGGLSGDSKYEVVEGPLETPADPFFHGLYIRETKSHKTVETIFEEGEEAGPNHTDRVEVRWNDRGNLVAVNLYFRRSTVVKIYRLDNKGMFDKIFESDDWSSEELPQRYHLHWYDQRIPGMSCFLGDWMGKNFWTGRDRIWFIESVGIETRKEGESIPDEKSAYSQFDIEVPMSGKVKTRCRFLGEYDDRGDHEKVFCQKIRKKQKK